MPRRFMTMLKNQWSRGNFVCVGLDSDFGKIPEAAHRSSGGRLPSIPHTIVAFNRAIVEATKDIVCAYKPNIAFYEAYGAEGITALQLTICDIHQIAPDVPVILDAKRADIGNTNKGYLRAVFNWLGADAITVHPYLGAEALRPFLDLKDKGIFVLCRTSNPGAGEFQDQTIVPSRENEKRWELPSGPGGEEESTHMPLYEYVAHAVKYDWNTDSNCALVVGATYPDELCRIRQIVGDMPILIPGIGAQGGDLEATVKAGKDSNGEGMIINSSRGIIFASISSSFAQVARQETEKLRDQINLFR